MKGLIISIIVFAGYVVTTILASHVFKPKRHGRLFTATLFAFSPLYFIAYTVTPANIYVLPDSLLIGPRHVDMFYGYTIFLLNCHSYIDFFFGFNGGFSMSLILLILNAGTKGITSETLISSFRIDPVQDKIYSWRLPALIKNGCITKLENNGYALTAKGRAIALISRFCKRLLNLGAGG